MQWIRGNGLRREILGNLIIVSLFAFFLTGIGVWLIHGKQMLEQSLLRRTFLLNSLKDEIEHSWSEVLVGNTSDVPFDLRSLQGLVVRYWERDPKLQIFLVDPHSRVMASAIVQHLDLHPQVGGIPLQPLAGDSRHSRNAAHRQGMTLLEEQVGYPANHPPPPERDPHPRAADCDRRGILTGVPPDGKPT